MSLGQSDCGESKFFPSSVVLTYQGKKVIRKLVSHGDRLSRGTQQSYIQGDSARPF